MPRGELSKSAQQAMGLPVGYKAYSPFPFSGMNLQASGLAIADQEFVWLENFIKQGDGNLRTAWDVGSALYTATGGKKIVSFYFYNIGTTQYVAVFLDDGSAAQVNVTTGATTTIGGAGTFYSSANGQLPACAPWGTQYLLIANRNTVNDYWAWDGSTLYTAGTAAPNGVVLQSSGLNYASAPTVVAVGGSGTGMTLVATVDRGGVVDVQITNPGTGYQIGDVVQALFSGGGSDNEAYLTANLTDGTVSAVSVTANGSNYTNATVSFSGGGGSGAAATAVIGSPVASVTVDTAGSGYTSATVDIVSADGAGSGATARATVLSGVTAVAVTAGGSNYTSATVAFTGGGGSGASATAVIKGVISRAAIIAGGSGYTSAPTVTISGDGSGATATATVTGGVTSATVGAGGSGYTSTPTVTITGDGTGATATATISGGGAVTAITITNAGSGYTTAGVVISGGGGSGATATATVSGIVSGINITNAGSNYTTATISFSGGGGSNASARAIILGSISSISVGTPGSGYTSAPGVTISGDGSGATATATVASGTISAITMVTNGSGYTTAPNVVISGDGVGAAAHATLGAGQVVSVSMSSGGSGYTSAPTVSITGDGTGATAVALLNPTGVKSVTVQNGGSGYIYAPTISFVGGGGSGASGVAQLSSTSIARVNVVSGGANYQKPPTITFVGGNATHDAKATAVLAGGQVVQINVTDGGSGYTTNPEVIITPQKNDTGTGAGAIALFTPSPIASVLVSSGGTNYTSAPAVVITPGANKAASALIQLMPYGVSGSSLETYQSRAWIANPKPQSYSRLPAGGNFQVSAPGSFTDFATSDGGVLFSNSDGFLQTKYTNIRQSAGYLYFFGDGSVSVVSGVTTSGSPVTTGFQYQNVDPQTGLSWSNSLADFGRSLIFANETGVYGLYGGTAAKISDKLNGLFNPGLFPPTFSAATPSSAVATLFDVKHYLMLMSVVDPETSAVRPVMIAWNEKDWFVLSQSIDMTFIGTQKVQSKLYAWGTDGSALYPMFNQPSLALLKRAHTKHYGSPGSIFMTKQLMNFYMQAQDQTSSLTGVSATCGFVISGIALQLSGDGSVPSGIAPDGLFLSPNVPAVPPAWPLFGTRAMESAFVNVSARLSSHSPDFILGNMMLGYVDAGAYMG